MRDLYLPDVRNLCVVQAVRVDWKKDRMLLLGRCQPRWCLQPHFVRSLDMLFFPAVATACCDFALRHIGN